MSRSVFRTLDWEDRGCVPKLSIEACTDVVQVQLCERV